MTVILEIPAEREEGIRQAAEARGLTVEAWLLQLAEIHEPDTPYLKTPEERVRFFREWMKSRDPNTPVLSDEAMSRESIY
jgi:hypothetical protein